MGRLFVLDPRDPGFAELVAPGAPEGDRWLAGWRDLAGDGRDPFTHPCWVAAYLRRLAAKPGTGPLRLVLVEEEDHLAAALALEVQDRGPGRLAPRVVVPPDVHQLCASIAVRRDALPAILRDLFTGRLLSGVRPVVLRLDQVDAGHPVLEAGGVPRRVRPRMRRFLLDLGDDAAAFARHLPRKTRRNLAQARNRARRAGGSSLAVARDPAGVARILELFLRLEHAGWKGRAGSSVRSDPLLERFFREGYACLAELGEAVAFLLAMGERPAAAALGFLPRGEGTCYLHKIAYDEGLAAASPGHLLVAAAVEELRRLGVRVLNFLGDARWLEAWNPRESWTWSVELYAGPLAARLAPLAWASPRRGARRLLRRAGLLGVARRLLGRAG